ncbi:MAG: hydroxylamine reductase [Gammaproteobacteria bacterium]|nr:hydroxylamine reductase [Gammaproteobacteria bacterium]
MFCNQCEQTTRTPMGAGCTVEGVCGKTEKTAYLQDLIVYAAKAIGQYATRARKLGVVDDKVDRFVASFLFTTLTNVNFDDDALAALLKESAVMRDSIRQQYEDACRSAGIQPETLTGPAVWRPTATVAELVRQGGQVAQMFSRTHTNEDIAGLVQLATYGLKGYAAYATHAQGLGQTDEAVYATLHESLDALCNSSPTADELLALNLKIGEMNFKVMELLDTGHTTNFGHPEPTQVRVSPVKGKAILISGHDMMDLEALLKATQGKGLNIYTHGEMLPGHAYPELKKYPHLVANYGGAWQDQQEEFAKFPGPILMTSNCIIEPKESYKPRIFTTGPVGWPGLAHIENHDFSALINAALSSAGFAEDAAEETITIGFAHNAVLGVADKVIDAVKAGEIKHFYLVGGCDGAKTGRDYYTEFVEKAPNDTVILTLGCAKYRFNRQELGDIGGIPRLLDLGQCNDAYSAVKIALALADAFECEVNDLPLSLIISWFEQKAVVILLTLLHLGLKNVRLGPSLPAFITPNVLNILVDAYQIKPITTAEEDLAAIAAA